MKHQEKNKKRAGIGGSNSSSSTKKSGTIWVPYHEIEESQEDPEVVAALDAFFNKSIGSPEPPLPPPQDAPDDPPPQRQQNKTWTKQQSGACAKRSRCCREGLYSVGKLCLPM